MIIGTPKDITPHQWDNKVFVSQPYFKLVFPNGFGLYILNSYKYNLIPRFYGTIHKTYWEFGFYFAGYIFEVMWNKSFKYGS